MDSNGFIHINLGFAEYIYKVQGSNTVTVNSGSQATLTFGTTLPIITPGFSPVDVWNETFQINSYAGEMNVQNEGSVVPTGTIFIRNVGQFNRSSSARRTLNGWSFKS